MKSARSLWMIPGFLLCCLLAAGSAQAQIVPDGTLGRERSQVAPMDLKRDRIEGGAARGVNLFHSFLDFNVGEGRGAYFANPTGVQNIFSRVIGGNLSKIDGTLGVLGKANLFLLNPNGIIFGHNSRLDVAGSFFASTASGFKFPDGSEFSATNPQEAPLLAVNLTPGLQWGERRGAIANGGNLTVGRDLTLSGGTVTSTGQLSAPQGQLTVEATAGDVRARNVTAQTATLSASNNLILEESQLRTTEDLKLLAQNTVRVRDSVTAPFIAQAGGNLLIQGNQSIDVLALDHPQTLLDSGNNLSLISNGNVSGDTHFSAKGNFSILNLAGKPTNFVSLYDPVIQASGDVIFGDYTGAALKVEAGGSIQGGNITINRPECLAGSENCAAGIPITDPDFNTLTASPSLILRAGVPVTLSNVPQFRVGDLATDFQPAILSQPTGSIQVGNIATLAVGTISGSVTLFAKGNIAVAGSIDTTAYAAPGFGTVTLNAGKINLESTDGNITIGSPDRVSVVRSPALSSILLDSTGKAILLDNQFIVTNNSNDVNNGNGGDIILNAPKGVVNVTRSVVYTNIGQADGLGFDNFSCSGLCDVDRRTGGVGKAGDITIIGQSVYLLDSRFDVNAYSGQNASSFGTGRVGKIFVQSSNTGITQLVGSQLLASSYSDAPVSPKEVGGITIKGGLIQINESPNSPNDGQSYPFSIIDSSTHGKGLSGDINLSGNSIFINDRSVVTTRARPGSVAQPGNIFIRGDAFVALTGGSQINSDRSNTSTGSFSKIGIIAPQGSILLDQATVTTKSSSSQYAGDVYINASRVINILNSSSISGDGFKGRIFVGSGSDNANVLFPDYDNWKESSIVPTIVTINNSKLTTTNQVDDNIVIRKESGDIRIRARESIAVNNSLINATTSSEGNAGIIELRAGKIVLASPLFSKKPTKVSSETQGNGDAGRVFLEATNSLNLDFAENFDSIDAIPVVSENIVKLDRSAVSTSTVVGTLGGDSKDNDGVTVRGYSLTMDNGSQLTAKTSGTGNAGSVVVSLADFLRVLAGSELNAQTETSANAGEVKITAPNQVEVNGKGSIIATQANNQIDKNLATGGAGSVQINTRAIKVQNGAQISASNISNRSSKSGITLQGVNGSPLSSLEVTDGLISASTETGAAGDVSIHAPGGLIELNGSLPDGTPGGLTVQATNGGTAGRLDVVTQNINIRNGAQVSVSSQKGQAGNLNITANQIALDNGKLIALTGANASSGESTGNITLTGLRILSMQNESKISATAEDNATGGNVNIDAAKGFIFGFYPTGSSGSDISANATQGNGGKVTINRTAIFGLAYRSQLTPLNDITASSESGLQGTVTFRGIDVDPTRGLAPLPSVPTDPSNRIDSTCAANRDRRTSSQFVKTGRGGLPATPDDLLNPDATVSQLATLSPSNPSSRTANTALPKDEPTSPPVEAQGWVRLRNGKIKLVTQTRNANSQNNWQSSLGCYDP